MIPKIIVIGGTGFLGNAILQDLRNIDSSNKYVYRTLQSHNDLQITSVSPDLDSRFEVDEFFRMKNSSFQIINCASSRYSKNQEESRNANYANPLLILNSALKNSSQKVKWLQPESFWQYTTEVVPDFDYIKWKNHFSAELELRSAKGYLDCHRVVLPHLIGVGDDLNRFLTKLFLELITLDKLIIRNGDETFAVADVRDVSRFFVQLLSERSVIDYNNVTIFPYIEITLKKIIECYLEGFDGKPVIIWENVIGTKNPQMNLARNFQSVDSQFSTSPIQNTLSNIRSWLQGIPSRGVK